MSENNREKPVLALVPDQGMSETKKKLIPLRTTFREGDVIFAAGDAGHTLFVVETGEVQITLPHPHPKMGIQVELAVVGKGGILGDGAVFGSATRSATALAQTDCTLLEFTREQFLGVFLTGGDRSEAIFRSLLKRTHQTNDRYLEKVRQVVDLEERISGLEADRLDASWFSEKNSQESTAAKTALEQARTEIAELRGELARHRRIADEEMAAWKKVMNRLDEENHGLLKRLRDSEREQAVLLETLTVSDKRKTSAIESADEASRQAFDQIEALKGELRLARSQINGLQEELGLYRELAKAHRKHPLGRVARTVIAKELLDGLEALLKTDK